MRPNGSPDRLFQRKIIELGQGDAAAQVPDLLQRVLQRVADAIEVSRIAAAAAALTADLCLEGIKSKERKSNSLGWAVMQLRAHPPQPTLVELGCPVRGFAH